MINRKIWHKKIILLTLFLVIMLIIIVAPYKLSCSSQSAMINQPLINSVNIVNGITTVNGKPFFPFGFYHVSWKSKTEDLIADIRDIAAAGFNTIHASATDVNNYGKFLDEANRLGIYVFSEPGIGLLNMIDSFKQKPTVLGWNIADDVDNGKLMPQEVLKFHQQAKLSDPNHLTYISGYSNKIKQFGNCADVVAMQSYPIGNGGDEISSTYDRVSIVRDAVAPYQKAVYANVQTFAWQNKKPGESHPIRIPTFDEVRNMTYQALLAGAKGIIYYTYHDGDWHLPLYPDLWAGMKTLVPEIKAISSFLLNGDLKNIETGVKNLLAGIWLYQNQTLAVVINTSYDRINEVAIKLPANVREAKPIFPNRASGMSVKNGQLTGSLNPLAVHVYILRN